MKNFIVTMMVFNFYLVFSLEAFDFSFQLDNSYYDWKEYGQGNKKLLEEEGFIGGISGNIYFHKGKDDEYSYRLNIGGYEGSINYDGQDQKGNEFYTTTDIKGVKGEVVYFKNIYDKSEKSLKLEVTGGIGFDIWKRRINSGNSYEHGITASASYVTGYNEYYRQLYASIGVLSSYKKCEVEFGTRYPLYFDEKVELSKIGYLNDINVEPEKEFSPYLKGSYMLKENLKIGLDIETKLIESSNSDEAYYYGDFGEKKSSSFLQPKSMQIKGTISLEYYI